MPESAILVLTENVLRIAGAGIGFLVGYIAYKGYKETGSTSLLRLAFAFLLLFVGFLISGLVGLSSIELPVVAPAVQVLLVSATVFETTGYFFLAFSHALDVRAGNRLPLLFVPLAGVDFALKSLSMIFLFYGITETLLSYMRLRKRATAIIASGLGLLAVGEFLRWEVFLYPSVDLILAASIAFKVAGLVALLIPVLKYAMYADMEKMMTDV